MQKDRDFKLDHGSSDSSSTTELSNSGNSAPSVLQGSLLSSNHSFVINWTELSLHGTRNECVLGQGSFGTVIRARWKRKPFSTKNGAYRKATDVAVKVLTRWALNNTADSNFDVIKEQALKECEIVKQANILMQSDATVKFYGVVEGPLPDYLISMFPQVKPGEEAMGIVMRCEAGGSLETLLHPAADKVKHPLTLLDSLRLLLGVAIGISELHAIGIIHGDIKPANVLLTHHSPPEVRLADFGVSSMRDANEQLDYSTMNMTNKKRGTLYYCAPEMLENPADLADLANSGDDDLQVARASRKTDMYAFAILAWETLTRKRPFIEIKKETILAARVHRGVRPSKDQLPAECPQAVVDMMEACWSKDRSTRLPAMECVSLLDYHCNRLAEQKFDIFFSHAWVNKPFLSHAYRMLARAGYRVWYDMQEMGYNLKESMHRGIVNSCVVVACINQTYQSRPACMFEIEDAHQHDKPVNRLPSHQTLHLFSFS
jgi:serine/threonine protein kinase